MVEKQNLRGSSELIDTRIDQLRKIAESQGSMARVMIADCSQEFREWIQENKGFQEFERVDLS